MTTTSKAITTTSVDIATLNKLHNAGWKLNEPCIIDILLVGDMPELYITQKNGLHVSATIAFDL